MSNANERQVGGDHYKMLSGGEEHWDRIWRLYGRGYFVGAITKYVERYPFKEGIKDLEKAKHFLEKLIELETIAAGDYSVQERWNRSTAMLPNKYQSLVELFQEGPGGNIEVLSDKKCFELGQVSPTGWVQFVFEGAHKEGYLYTCRECNAKFNVPPETNPHTCHECHGLVDSVQQTLAATAS